MADSQNTYQNDVKIKKENNFGKIFVGIIAAAVIGFCGYGYVDTEIDKAYDSGLEAGYDEGEQVGYNKGHSEGYDKGYDEGYDKGYDEGYDDAKEKYKSSSNSSTSNKSTNKGNSSSGNSNKNNYSSTPKYDYILNKNTDKFHYTWCYSVDQMKEKNKVYFTGTRQEVINKGYSPCGNCNP